MSLHSGRTTDNWPLRFLGTTKLAPFLLCIPCFDHHGQWNRLQEFKCNTCWATDVGCHEPQTHLKRNLQFPGQGCFWPHAPWGGGGSGPGWNTRPLPGWPGVRLVPPLFCWLLTQFSNYILPEKAEQFHFFVGNCMRLWFCSCHHSSERAGITGHVTSLVGEECRPKQNSDIVLFSIWLIIVKLFRILKIVCEVTAPWWGRSVVWHTWPSC